MDVLYRNFGEGRWGISWILLHRNRVRIGCEGCMKTNSLYQVPGTLIAIGRIYRKQARKAPQQLIQTVWINSRIGNAPFRALEVLSDRLVCDLCVGVFVTPPRVTVRLQGVTRWAP
jgi:hypothetical protein